LRTALPDGQRNQAPSVIQLVQAGLPDKAVSAGCADCWALRRCGACFATQAAAASAGGAAGLAEECARLRRAEERNLALVVRALRLPERTRAWLETTTVG